MVCLYDGRSANKKTPFKLQYETAYNLELISCEPRFNSRYEFREFSFYPHSKLVIKVSFFGFYYLLNCYVVNKLLSDSLHIS